METSDRTFALLSFLILAIIGLSCTVFMSSADYGEPKGPLIGRTPAEVLEGPAEADRELAALSPAALAIHDHDFGTQALAANLKPAITVLAWHGIYVASPDPKKPFNAQDLRALPVLEEGPAHHFLIKPSGELEIGMRWLKQKRWRIHGLDDVLGYVIVVDLSADAAKRSQLLAALHLLGVGSARVEQEGLDDLSGASK